MVLIIDALDGGFDLETLDILRNEVPKLPGNFRIFLTSRPQDEIDVDLSDALHIQRTSIDIHSDANQRDITVYVWNRLRHVSHWKRLGAHWPDEQLVMDLTKKSEGLFIWVSTVSNYLCTTISPDRQLRSLLYRRKSFGLPAEEKMDQLYADNCNWRDEDFADGYKLIVGATMAAGGVPDAVG